MKSCSQEKANSIRLLLVLSQAKEAERLRERLARREPDFHLESVPPCQISQALANWTSGRADTLVCDLAVLSAEATPSLFNWGDHAQRPPLLVLVSPGMEERAASLLRRGQAECVVKVGNYEVLLAATVRRLTAQRRLGLPRAAQGPMSPPPARPDLDQLAVVLRHEINNPLTGILGNAELLLATESKLSADARRRVETIAELALRLRDLLRNLEQMVSGTTATSSLAGPRPARIPAARG